MSRYYILRDNEVIEEPDYDVWAEWHASQYRHVECVALTELAHAKVSTHFLAVNMSLSPDEPPLLFETRVNGGWIEDTRERFATLDEARANHEAWVEKLRSAEEENHLPPPGATW
jgi:hypothetical protein